MNTQSDAEWRWGKRERGVMDGDKLSEGEKARSRKERAEKNESAGMTMTESGEWARECEWKGLTERDESMWNTKGRQTLPPLSLHACVSPPYLLSSSASHLLSPVSLYCSLNQLPVLIFIFPHALCTPYPTISFLLPLYLSLSLFCFFFFLIFVYNSRRALFNHLRTTAHAAYFTLCACTPGILVHL